MVCHKKEIGTLGPVEEQSKTVKKAKKEVEDEDGFMPVVKKWIINFIRFNVHPFSFLVGRSSEIWIVGPVNDATVSKHSLCRLLTCGFCSYFQ